KRHYLSDGGIICVHVQLRLFRNHRILKIKMRVNLPNLQKVSRRRSAQTWKKTSQSRSTQRDSTLWDTSNSSPCSTQNAIKTRHQKSCLKRINTSESKRSHIRASPSWKNRVASMNTLKPGDGFGSVASAQGSRLPCVRPSPLGIRGLSLVLLRC
ncbi:hypothetical protein KC19_12G140500, partial [Ceratodon purpureus]